VAGGAAVVDRLRRGGALRLRHDHPGAAVPLVQIEVEVGARRAGERAGEAAAVGGATAAATAAGVARAQAARGVEARADGAPGLRPEAVVEVDAGVPRQVAV